VYTTHLAGEVARATASMASAELFERIMERIHRYFLKLVQTEDEAQECLQETLVLLERSLREGTYDPSRSFNTWIWVKARSVFAQRCRRLDTRRTTPLDQGGDGLTGDDGTDAHRRIEQRLDAAAVLAAVRRRLGEETYEAFVLFYEGGLTKGEVAEVLGRVLHVSARGGRRSGRAPPRCAC
jgi:RNA polymerase sigma factor (sigma-70 family)